MSVISQMNEDYEFSLSEKELEYLTQLAEAEQPLAKLLARCRDVGRNARVLRMNRVEAQNVRDFLTRQLAATGFDRDYSPNDQGQMLETLIDRFYIS